MSLINRYRHVTYQIIFSLNNNLLLLFEPFQTTPIKAKRFFISVFIPFGSLAMCLTRHFKPPSFLLSMFLYFFHFFFFLLPSIFAHLLLLQICHQRQPCILVNAIFHRARCPEKYRLNIE